MGFGAQGPPVDYRMANGHLAAARGGGSNHGIRPRSLMPTTDPRVDAFIERSAEFARPILRHLRKVVHASCPQAVETIKWGMPAFMYHGILCGMASFKKHCAFGFWHRGIDG